MEIQQLRSIEYYINEAEAFGRQVATEEDYTVTLALPAGTKVDNYLQDGQRVQGNYIVNGVRTYFEAVVDDISIKREFQAGWDMYNLSLSESEISLVMANVLTVPEGGTGTTTLSGLLKGNGGLPVVQAIEGEDYMKPIIKDTPFVPISASGVTVGDPLDFSYAVMSNVLYLRCNNITASWATNEGVKTIGKIQFPSGVKVPFQVEGTATLRVSGNWEPIRVLIQTNGDVMLARGKTTATGNAGFGCVLPYPIVKA